MFWWLHGYSKHAAWWLKYMIHVIELWSVQTIVLVLDEFIPSNFFSTTRLFYPQFASSLVFYYVIKYNVKRMVWTCDFEKNESNKTTDQTIIVTILLLKRISSITDRTESFNHPKKHIIYWNLTIKFIIKHKYVISPLKYF